MDTPICDFIKEYCAADMVRLHMPGHKGCIRLGPEYMDITEVMGADALYECSGIIAKSEANATAVFNTQRTCYSTEGSSQCIRAMLYLALHGQKQPLVLAARNVHKSFVYACAMMDARVEWLYSDTSSHLCSCNISPLYLRQTLQNMQQKPNAVYITSPDYLGNMSDIASLAGVCREYDVPLLVDNAHGAYLHFLEQSLHPIHLGATMCCDSAHKTLPVLTGGAYLQIAGHAPKHMADQAKQALALFGSTSPSYLIMQSLDLCNRYLAEDFRAELQNCLHNVNRLKHQLQQIGFVLYGDEPLKITIDVRACGMHGADIASALRLAAVECEFYDADSLVMMFSPGNKPADYERILHVFEQGFPSRTMHRQTVTVPAGEYCMSIRDAIFSPHKVVPVEQAVGCICGNPLVSCPPAVPLAMAGEKINAEMVEAMIYYGVENVEVVTNHC